MASAPSISLSPQLAGLRKQFEECSARARAMLTGNSGAVLRANPATGGWSILQCVAHLSLTNQSFAARIESAFSQAKPGSEPYKKDFVGRMFAWVLEPPYRLKVKTRPDVDPISVGTPEEVLANFLASQQMIFGWLARANGLAISGVKVESPFKKGVYYNLFSVFHILAAHERRHLWQAEQVRKLISK